MQRMNGECQLAEDDAVARVLTMTAGYPAEIFVQRDVWVHD